jgi:tetratricopeptide (TPR) repeat protein
MKYPLIFSFGSAALVFLANPAVAKSPAEVEQIARSVSVAIQFAHGREGGQRRVGSGTIIHRKGNVYSIITNYHMACGLQNRQYCIQYLKRGYTMITADGRRYYTPIVKKVWPDLDIVIMEFYSSTSYPVAQMADSDSLKVDDRVYTAGFLKKPAWLFEVGIAQSIVQNRLVGEGWLFGVGKARAIVQNRLVGDRGGYTVIYDVETKPGMDGGGAFDSNGRLVALHGQGDFLTERLRQQDQRNTENTAIATQRLRKKAVGNKIGHSRGIAARWIVQGLKEWGISNLQSPDRVRMANPGPDTAIDELLIAGFNQFIDPRDNQPAAGALAKFQQAAALNNSTAYFLQAYAKERLNDPQGALADYDRVIAIDPKHALAYNNRGTLKADKLKDPQGALADLSMAISLNPKDPEAYINRGNLKQDKLNDPQGALADLSMAISLNPKDPEAYNSRGNLKQDKMNDPQGALADYNQTTSLDPEYAEAYYNRGILRQDKLNDRPGAISDFRTAVKIFSKNGQTAGLQSAVDALRQLGTTAYE